MSLYFEPTMPVLRPLLAQLQSVAVTLPDGVEQAAAMHEVVTHPDAYKVKSLGPALLTASREEIAEHVLRRAAGRGLENDIGNARAQVGDELAAAIAQLLRENADQIIDQMRPAFDAAAAKVTAAHTAGIRPPHGPQDVIDLGPKAVAAWQQLGSAVARLDAIAAARLTLATVLNLPPNVDSHTGAAFSKADAKYRVGAETDHGRWLRLAAAGLNLNTIDQTRALAIDPPRPPLVPTPDINVNGDLSRLMLPRGAG